LDIFSNNTFLGTDDRGLPAEPEQDEEGHWHVTGTLDVAPARALQRIAKLAAEIVVAAGPALIILSMPLARYVMMPCCNDEGQVDNFDTSGYDNILRSGQGAVKEALERELAGCNSRVLYFDPHTVFGEGPLRELATMGGESIWSEDEGVHLTPAAYDDIMAAVVGLWQEPTTAGRRRVASLVQEAAPAPQRGGGVARPGGNRGGSGRGYNCGRTDRTQGRRFAPY
jgi:hypothetical protein